jgi:Transposase DNA-binding
MSHWGETERVACQLPDARHAKRLARLCTRLSEQPVHRMPRACHGGAETVAAERVLDQPASDAPEMRSGHTHAPRARMRAQAVVLLGHDTPLLADGTSPPKQGRGTVKSKVGDESRRPPTVAFPPARVTLGG